MDPLTGLLDGARAQDAFVLRSVHGSTWSVRVQDGTPLNVVAVRSGEPWILPSHGEPIRLRPFDVAVMRGPEPFGFADDPRTPVGVVVRSGPRRTTPNGRDLSGGEEFGVRSWGTDEHGSTTLLIGKYRSSGHISPRLLRALPPAMIARDAADELGPLVSLLDVEIGRSAAGQGPVLDRLVDLLLATALRVGWISRVGGIGVALDPVVGNALRRMESSPQQPWTVERLAKATGVSRATFARRFTDLVGESPIAFLTERRLDLAARLLAVPGTTIDSVARQVGYASASAFSTAFKRSRGISPQDFRASTEG